MKICSNCQTPNPAAASYCMTCGHELSASVEEPKASFNFGGLNTFMLSIVGSIAISLVLIFVFRLPVFFLAAFLPLLWSSRKKE